MSDHPRHFKSAAEFRHWLELNHAAMSELWIGFYKKASGKGGMTYAEALDEALCFGWIDGLKKRVDEVSFKQRFTPRNPRSIWSLVNIGHVRRLQKAGLMTPIGLKVFQARSPSRSGVYSFESKPPEFSPDLREILRAESSAWQFFKAQPPGYQRVACFWVMSAKLRETRERRLAQLIKDSKSGRRLKMLGA